VVIRTIVARGTTMSIGTGDGVVVLSTRDACDEAVLKGLARRASQVGARPPFTT